jgi:hypothetical protein
MSNGADKSDASNPRTIVGWLVLIGVGAFTALFLFGAAINIVYGPWLLQLVKDHFPATVGLPFAALAALCLVLLLEFKAGRMEFEALGLKFKGAAAPAIVWVLCFLSITLAIKLLW